jgi:hypothetical protein
VVVGTVVVGTVARVGVTGAEVVVVEGGTVVVDVGSATELVVDDAAGVAWGAADPQLTATRARSTTVALRRTDRTKLL